MHILDTGPIFKFLATDCPQELLLALGHNQIHVPEAVEYEVLDTPKRRPQFQRAADLWPRIPDRFMTVIPDTPTEELRECCREVLGLEFDEMYAQTKDRGENMAILHGVIRARAGDRVILICDEEAGSAVIRQQSRRLAFQHMRGQHTPGGAIEHADTLTLLRWAIERGGFQGNRAEFIKRYNRMASLDEALPRDVTETGLTKSPPWP